MALPDGSVQIFSEVTRFATLDVDGFPAVGSNTYTTDQLLKATFTPVLETGVDISLINSNGDIAAHTKHGDMPKYFTAALELATPDPVLHQMIAGGTVFIDNTAGLTAAPTGSPTAVGRITAGILPAGTYGYLLSQYNTYGENFGSGVAVSSEITGSVASGTSGTMVVGSGITALAATALGLRVYGRAPGGEQFLGTVPNFYGQASSGSVATPGSATTVPVTALTKAIPEGATFQISGDTNSVKYVFTTTAPAGVGATVLSVTTQGSGTTTIAAAAILPVFVDDGTQPPSGHYGTTDTTAGPGAVGWQAPPLAVVGNKNGISCEFWGQAILNGTQASYLPYQRWVIPGCKNFHEEARTFQAAVLENTYTGQAVENPNWGNGPFNDWPFDSTAWAQHARMSRSIEPVAGFSPVPATL